MSKNKSARSRQNLRRAVGRWINKADHDDDRNLNLPIPTQVISNEEYYPIAQTDEQKLVEHRLIEIADRNAKKLGLSRRQFLATSGGMAAAFMAMNSVFGKYFDVEASETFEPAAYNEKWPKKEFIFDIQTHHVSYGRNIPPLLGFRRQGGAWNPALKASVPKMEDLYLANYIKEVFFDSDTMMAVISGFPNPIDNSNILPPPDMVETRAEINGLSKSQRIVSHGLFSPDTGLKSNLDYMSNQVENLKIQAWKGYPGQPLGPDHQGWWMDDEKLAYPVYEYSRKVGIKTICAHKGLPLAGFNVEHCSPKDVPKAAMDFPDLNFILYHSAFKSLQDALPAAKDNFKTTSFIPWTSLICEARKKNPSMTNVYMELGSTFGMLVITAPLLCGHVLGMIIDAFGDDHVMWGTDSIWWGSPQWQIEAFRRFQMPEELMKQFGYKPLTKESKEKILGLNAARIYGIDVKAKRNAIPSDYVTKLKNQYKPAGNVPRNTQYGWIWG
ncbi:MAG: amidohydrolase family protein [Blastocatellia bacterium]